MVTFRYCRWVMCVLAHFLGWCIEKRLSQPSAEGWDNTLWAWLGIGIVDHPITGAYAVPQRVTIMGAYLLFMTFLMLYFFAPLTMNPFIYFQF